jgi:2-amino-4-hydroxy-6-hydroxymethyldihydropteridine diphosphokinase
MDAMVTLLGDVLHPPVKLSKLMETEPVGTPDEQQWYYNRIVSGRYNGSAQSLLEECRGIEKTLGRTGKNTLRARTADIDILLIDNCIIIEEDFIIPHPQILQRRFCLEGMYSIEPDRIHPTAEKTIRELYEGMESSILEQKIHFIGL